MPLSNAARADHRPPDPGGESGTAAAKVWENQGDGGKMVKHFEAPASYRITADLSNGSLSFSHSVADARACLLSMGGRP